MEEDGGEAAAQDKWSVACETSALWAYVPQGISQVSKSRLEVKKGRLC